jgi:hypothetical protein
MHGGEPMLAAVFSSLTERDTMAESKSSSRGDKPSTQWVEFVTSQAGFHMNKRPDGTMERGSMFSYTKGDKVEKPAEEAEQLIARGTCKRCKAPEDAIAA